MSVAEEQVIQQEEENNNGLEAKFLSACYDGNSKLAQELVDQGVEIFCTDETGRSALHFAAASGDIETMDVVLKTGIPWNCLDYGGYSAGDYALQTANSQEAYDFLVSHGIRVELIMETLDKRSIPISTTEKQQGDFERDARDNTSSDIPNEDYLNKPIVYTGDRILDAQNNGVMMEWEQPLMAEHAKAICPTPGLKILNIGFGMGIVDREIQLHNPGQHVIVEAHPDVYKHIIETKFLEEHPTAKVIFGRWQDKLEEIKSYGPYDGIFFDTFGEYYADMQQFHEAIFASSEDKELGHNGSLLKKDGIYSFFNGLGGHSILFHDVYCEIAKAHLKALGLSTQYSPILTDGIDDNPEIWAGVNRPYWMLKKYNMPVCKWDI
ncbi:Protein arginine N-methyltransferase 2 [Zancudomyces culisetae]|uniref:Protein arginine N-methyltransferase 2 n=1 Tax=Zancudomyces culisetae TaxID=1213189 RepID=A0A1R1PD97_ZANCU|nr:Protein arginine N-methyltransferase 2 [Zancudomyces culisetae]|eukprot:OMH78947.1 Protein arginine N-methyltransferase 2 [Zancudomyces culisetae]